MISDLPEHFRLLLITQNDDYLGLVAVGTRDLHAVFEGGIDRRRLIGVLQEPIVIFGRKLNHNLHGPPPLSYTRSKCKPFLSAICPEALAPFSSRPADERLMHFPYSL